VGSDSASEDAPPLEVEQLRYDIGGRTVLNGISLRVERREVLAVMGMSGCGKSTLLRNMMGLASPTSGEVRIEGRSLVGLSERELNEARAQVGMVFQQAALFDSMTVAGNVAFGLRRRRLPPGEVERVVREKLRLVGMAGTAHQMPAELSGGMRKRVGIARALALGPRVLLYDEPSSGLDPIMAGVIDDLIVRLRDELGVTSVLVSHHVQNVLRVADRVAMLHEGRIIALAPPEQFREATDPVVRQFVTGSHEGPIRI
jgi:phospholipid/cholesterol/gamma-HCH transport system ATP-binding protein